jgi:MFS family permease
MSTEVHVVRSDTGPQRSEARERARRTRRVFVASYIGSAIETYDFLIYSTAATLVFGHAFFPSASPTAGVLASLATLGVGYLARPIGGLIFGHVGDRMGRKGTLIITLVAMSLCTVLIGLLPTYETIGIWAPVLLVVLRLAQGLAVGGEWGGAVLLSVEHASAKRRAFLGSATNMGAGSGFLLAFLAFGAVSAATGDGFAAWGWRIPFVATIVLLGLGLYIRLKVEESPIAAETTPVRFPLGRLLREYPRRLALAVGLTAGPFLCQAVATTTVVAYATGPEFGIPRQTLINALIIASACQVVTIPLYGMLADRIGRRPVFMAACLVFAVQAFLIVPMVTSGVWALILISYLITLPLLYGATHGVVGALLSELYPTEIRYTGVSASFQLAASIGGGVGPVVAAALLATSNGSMLLSILLALGALISLGCVAALRETRSVDLHRVVPDRAAEPDAATPIG